MRKLEMDELGRASLESFKEQPKFPIAIVLDNVRSMLNVGSVFRSSDAFNVEKLLLCGITAKPPHREINKTALGATDSVTWEHHATTVEALQQLKSAGFQLIAIEQVAGSVKLQEFQPKKDQKYAFIFGHEAFGVHDDALALCDSALEIPQFGTKHSLNISVSAGVIIWDYVQKCHV